MLTITVARSCRSSGSFSRMKRWTPIPCRPIAFSMPDGVSTMRSGGWPSRSLRKSPLVTNAPSVVRSTAPAYSSPYPKQPLAAISGLASSSAPIFTLRPWACSFPDNPCSVEYRPTEARTHVVVRAVVAHRNDAAVAAAHAASHDAFHRHLHAPSVLGAERCDGGEHGLGSARGNRETDVARVPKLALE